MLRVPSQSVAPASARIRALTAHFAVRTDGVGLPKKFLELRAVGRKRSVATETLGRAIRGTPRTPVPGTAGDHIPTGIARAAGEAEDRERPWRGAKTKAAHPHSRQSIRNQPNPDLCYIDAWFRSTARQKDVQVAEL